MESTPRPTDASPGVDGTTFETKYRPALRSEQLITVSQSAAKESQYVATGVRGMDMDCRNNLRLNTDAEYVDGQHYRAIINSWSDTILYKATMSWLRVINDNPYGLRAGRFDGAPAKPSTTITFARPYEQPPAVVVWLSGLDLGAKSNWRLKVESKDITRQGFTITLGTWNNTVWHSASANWITHRSDVPGIVSGSYNSEQVRPWNKPAAETHGSSNFAKPFSKAPYVLTALTSIDFDAGNNMRFTMPLKEVTPSGFSWGLDTWDGFILYSATASYIAFEQVRPLLMLIIL